MSGHAAERNKRTPSVSLPVWAATAICVLLGVWFLAGWGGPRVIRPVDDIACALASGLAAYVAWRRSRRPGARSRSPWALVAVGAFAWMIGDLIWTIADLGSDIGASNVLVAEAGFLALPLLCCAAILKLPAGDRQAKRRWVLDGAVVALSTCFMLWTFISGMADVKVRGLKLVVYSSFPIADVAALTAILIAATYATVGQLRLRVLAGAVALLTVADSGFAYLTITDSYGPGAYCDVAYLLAFAALAIAAQVPDRHVTAPRRPHLAQPVRLLLPYLPPAAAAAIGMYWLFAGHSLGGAGLLLWTTVTALLLVRQGLVLLDNRRLLTDLQSERERLQTLTLTDTLTGLGNRALFASRVEHALQLRTRDDRAVAVCWIDVDDFKLVNDTYGHAVGDRALAALGARLAAAVRAGDTLARLGGDEFGVLLEDGGDPIAFAERLAAVADTPVEVATQPIRLPVSIGLAVLEPGDDAVTCDELLVRADVAMYAAKSVRGLRIRTYETGMTVPGARDLGLREPLKQAVRTKSLDVHYQPVVDASTGRLRGFEALARWTVDGRAIPPGVFIPLAERMGLSRALGEQVLDTALAQLARWGRSDVVMSVNLSPDQLLDVELPAKVAALLRRHGVDAGQLVLEITEGALLTDDPNALTTSQALTGLGVALALDDFGTGYSSLAHLRGFPLSVLKIDRTFIADVDTNAEARRFVDAIARLGRDLGLRLVAEGVERPSQFDAVRRVGPVSIQGYLFSPPRPAAAFDELIRDPRRRMTPDAPELQPVP